jgi:hypothetical protein
MFCLINYTKKNRVDVLFNCQVSKIVEYPLKKRQILTKIMQVLRSSISWKNYDCFDFLNFLNQCMQVILGFKMNS